MQVILAEKKRIVITGMSINTPLGDDLEVFLSNLLSGRSAITGWKIPECSKISSKVGGDMSGYDVDGKMHSIKEKIPENIARRLPKLMRYSPWSTRLSILLALDAFVDAGLTGSAVKADRIAAIVSGHNLNSMQLYRNWQQFAEAPNNIDPLLALSCIDSDHAGCISDALGILGPSYTAGGACASGNVAMRCAMGEIRQGAGDVALVVGAVYDFSPLELHSLGMMRAISTAAFNERPAEASRPFDTDRSGFVPSHGGGALVIEELDHALERGAHIYAELVGVEVISSASRLPHPSEEHEARVMERVLRNTGTDPSMIDFISAHATSTQLGDTAEVRAIRRVFGRHAEASLKINAPKSMLGHTCWASAVVEAVAAVLQMRSGRLHPSINVDRQDPEIDLDVCANRAVEHPVRYLLNNAFGFGGVNSSCIIRRYDE